MKEGFVTTIVCVLLLSACKKQGPTIIHKGYTVEIFTDNTTPHKAYLYKVGTTAELLDSTTIENKKGTFIGTVNHPSRYLITIDSLVGRKLVILENDSISITIQDNNLIDATVSGSEINTDLEEFQLASKKIYQKIELLFPEIQLARLENDADKLEALNLQMKAIDQENIDFNFNYIENHPNSYLSIIILSDLTKREFIDKNRVLKAFDSLDKNIRNSDDGKTVNEFLQ